MANVLNTDKQIAVIAALAEGSSIRAIERMTGIHRDTIMRLGVKVGQGCTALMDETMRDLPCIRLEMDEIWGFVGKKVFPSERFLTARRYGMESWKSSRSTAIPPQTQLTPGLTLQTIQPVRNGTSPCYTFPRLSRRKPPSEPSLFRSSEPMPSSKPKPKRPGRPPLPKGNAKGEMLRIRVTANELRAIEFAAKANGQTRSEFIRGKLLATQSA